MYSTLDFEDIFDEIDALELEDVEIVTPKQVESRLRVSWSAWDALYQANKNNPYIASEYKRFKLWVVPTLDSQASLYFASGTLNNLDKWDQRYQTAYGKATNTDIAPTPDDNKQIQLDSNTLMYVGIGLAAGLLLWALYANKSTIIRALP